MTATEICLRMDEAQPAMLRLQAAVERLLVRPLVWRMQWRLHLLEAGRGAQRQLTYTPKD